MKRNFVVFLISVMILGVFAGCSSGGSGDDSTGGGSDDGKVKISFWRHDFGPENKAIKKLISSFEEENPNITVDFRTFPQDQYETKIRTALASGDAPDIMAIDGPTIASYASKGAIVPLGDYMKQKDYKKDDIFDPVMEAMTYNGKIYAAPNNDASLAILYNIKMFKDKGIPLPSKDPSKPWTWDQYLKAAKKLTNADKGIYGFNPLRGGFESNEYIPFVEQPFLWQAGGEILGSDGSVDLDSPETKKALSFFKSLYDSGVAPKEPTEDAFSNGFDAAVIQGPWQISYIKENYPDFKLGEDYGVAPLWKGKKQVTPNGSWNMAITSDSKHPDEAWKFIKWVTGVKGSKVWYKQTNNLPARTSTVEAFPELQKYPMNIFVKQSEEYAHPRPVTPAYPKISEAVRLMFEKVTLNGEDIDTAVKNATQNIKAEVEK